NSLEGARVLDTTDRTLQMHLGGKIEVQNKSPLKSRDDLSMAYTPGVARVCEVIHLDPDKAFQYTIKRNTVAVVSDGTAVVGLAALLNALKLTERSISELRIVIVGVGAAGVAVARILLAAGARYLIGCDSHGALSVAREDYLDGSMHPVKRALAEAT